jgi:hypothetical protein
MAYVYGTDGDCFPLLIELSDEIDYFSPDYLERALWPRAPSKVVH